MGRLTRVRLLPCLLLLAAASSHGAMITYRATSLSASDPTLFRYIYDVNDVTFLRYQELDIVFAASLYAALTNGIAGADFDVMLFQPGIPPGAPGHFSALALREHPGPTSFSVDVRLLGAVPPASQTFFINQFDENGNFAGVVATEAVVSALPEPGTFALGGLALLTGCVWRAARRRPGTRA